MENTIYYREFKNIVVKGSPDYRRTIVEQLDKIWQTWTGWAVLRGIIDSGKTVTIVPYSAADEKTKLGRTNAFAWAKDAKAASPRGFWPHRGGADKLDTPKDERFETTLFLRGTGGG